MVLVPRGWSTIPATPLASQAPSVGWRFGVRLPGGHHRRHQL